MYGVLSIAEPGLAGSEEIENENPTAALEFCAVLNGTFSLLSNYLKP